jgi:hypothetical protein
MEDSLEDFPEYSLEDTEEETMDDIPGGHP